MTNMDNYCVIMGGGIGSRFWPFSRKTLPKQFLDFFGTGRSLLQQTFDRFQKVIPTENILIVTNAMYADLVKEQLPELDEKQILLEPARRNTAPCIAWAAYHIRALNPNANIVVARGYKVRGGTGGVAAICHGHTHAGVGHHAGIVIGIAKHADVLKLHAVELRHAHKAARLGHARIHELVEPLRGLQSCRLNSVIGKRRRPLNHPRHYLGRHGKHHLGLRLAQELGKIDHLVGHTVDAR